MQLSDGSGLILPASEEMNAYIIPGVQDVPKDWDLLKSALEPEVHFGFSTLPHFSKEKKETWKADRVAHHLDEIAIQNSNIIIAHSWGTHLAMELLLKGDNHYKAVILLNPPSKVIKPETSMQSSRTERESFSCMTEKMMWNMALEMDDVTFDSFVTRHEVNCTENRNRIRSEFELLKKGSSFEELTNEYQGFSPVLVMKAPQDPWDINVIPHEKDEFKFMQIETLNNVGHYPHVSKPVEVAAMIRYWLMERGVLKSDGFIELSAAERIKAQSSPTYSERKSLS